MKTALITGSSKGLGRALALAFATGGYDIILHGRDLKRLQTIRSAIRRKGRKCVVVAGDIKRTSTETALLNTAEQMKVNVLINNAAIYSNTPAHRLPDVAIQEMIDTNLTAQICLTSAVFSQFQRRKGGLIININSIAGKVPNFNEAVYCASKHGLRAFSESIRYVALKYNINVMDVYLGAMQTDMVRDRADYMKFIYPEEAAALIYSLTEPYKSLTIREVEIGRRNY
jgi:3-oxoacyl-[acyl-carrier protein] reductase